MAHVIKKEEWQTFSPHFLALAANGPGVLPAENMVRGADALHPFSKATTILDIGCGPAQVTHALLQQFGAVLPPQAKIVAGDTNEAILDGVRARKDRMVGDGMQAWSRVDVRTLDIMDLHTVPSGSVSHVLAGFVLFAFPDPARALAEIHRVLAPGGLFATSSFVEAGWLDVSRFPLRVRTDLSIPGIPEMWRSEEGVRTQLVNGSFVDVQVEETKAYFPVENVEETARFLLFRMPLNGRILPMLKDEEVEACLEGMAKDIRELIGGESGRLEGRGLIGFSRKA